MIYNDYNILSLDEYELIKSKYIENNFSRKNTANTLYSLVEQCSINCLSIKNKLNQNILNSLKNAKTNLELIMENLNANFKIIKTNKKTFNSINLFGFLINLNNILNNLIFWLHKEEKEYIKLFLNNTIKTILFIINNILSALEKSNLISFNYM